MTNNSLKKENVLLPISIVFSAILISGTWLYTIGTTTPQNTNGATLSILEEKVIPQKGITLPVRWGDLGAQLTALGVIDKEKFESLYALRGGLDREAKTFLSGTSEGRITITKDNAGLLLNLFWALGLANKNDILDTGEMMNPAYGGAGNFASTGGWTIAEGNAMDHYSRHELLTLTPQEQARVSNISLGVYRPCCDNSTHFPDCNHGMAMLGFLELMASQGVSEEDMWKAALAVNSYWFPDAYLTLATYMQSKGVDWKEVNPQEILGIDYSSASGYGRIASQVVEPQGERGGDGCGVKGGGTAAPVEESALPKGQGGQSGCGV